MNGQFQNDPSNIDGIETNRLAGAKKILTVGPSLQYLGTAATPIKVFAGTQLYIWTVTDAQTVTFGNSTVTSLALGAGGIPLIPSVWNYLSAGENDFIIASSGTVFIFQVQDDTSLRDEAKPTGF